MTSMIPTPGTVTAAWLTDCLQQSGHPNAQVRSFTAKRIGTGQIGMCIRYTMDVVGDDAAPRSLIGKFPSDDALSRQTGVALRNYIKEVSFYRTLKHKVGIHTPKCYFADIAGEGPDFALLLQDMAPAEQGDQLKGCAPDVARAAVLELIGLHAPTWNDESLKSLDWMGAPTEESRMLTRQIYQGNIPAFRDRLGSRLETDDMLILEQLGDSDAYWGDVLPDPFAIVHIDYRLDNLLINEQITPPQITVVDWQSLALGNPVADVAYFMGAGLLPDVRREVEQDIVRAYYDGICAAGISGYSWENCWNDYRRGTFAGFIVTVVAATLVVETERGNDMFTAMARRHARHALDLGAQEFLS